MGDVVLSNSVQVTETSIAKPMPSPHQRAARQAHSPRRVAQRHGSRRLAMATENQSGPSERSDTSATAAIPACHSSERDRSADFALNSGTAAAKNAIPAAISVPFGLIAAPSIAAVGVAETSTPATANRYRDQRIASSRAIARRAAARAALISRARMIPAQLGNNTSGPPTTA